MENTIIFKQGLTEINEQDMSHIQEVVRLFPNLSRQELARTLCEHLSWYSRSGTSKVKSCLTLYRSGKQRPSTPKYLFVKPLDPQFRTLLCSEPLQGRIIE